ncbi:MAG: tetraacyldisaccharide 4'-kinase [Rhodocyclaceae bacterium]|nr:tetraacyldisaccharide 4'-kinase [Rhodocyclaceae bacterium]
MLAAWSKRGALAISLLPLVAVFFCLASIRCWAYSAGIFRIATLLVPVVVVGNITVGGVGKTPLVIHLVEQLKARGHHPGVISRGYGGVGQGGEVHADDNAAQVGDEPLLIRRRANCPVVVGADRVQAARRLLEIAPLTTLIISDDGLQHYALPRTLEVMVVDERGFMNGWLLPAGPLRETARRLQEVDAIVGNGVSVPPCDCAAVPFFQMTMNAGDFYAIDDARRRVTSTNWHDKEVHAVAGIGAPERFFNQLRSLGIEAVNHAFPDHHRYTAEDIDFDGDAILTTEKDAVKLAHLKVNLPVWILPIDAVLAPSLADYIVAKLMEKNRGFPPS